MTTPSPFTGGDTVVVVGICVVVVVGATVVLVVVDGTNVVEVVVVDTLTDVGASGLALELELSAIGTTNAITAMNAVAPMVIGGRPRQ